MLRPARTAVALAVALAAVSLVATVPVPAAAQERALRAPNATLPIEFSQIRGVRELADGRVIVTDRIEERVVVADFSSGRQQLIGRTGTGPHEFHLPTTLTPMPGDSTLLVDEGNSRLGVISPSLTLHRTFTLTVPGIGYTLGARGVDLQGRFYMQIPGWMINAYARGDSVPVIRFDARSNRVDTLALVKNATSLPPKQPKYGLSFIAFSTQDVWAMASDGRIAVVRGGDYHVEWRDANGRVTRGAPIPFERIRVTAADRTAYSRSFLANSSVSGKGAAGELSLVPAEWMNDAAIREFVARNPFAEVKGPVTGTTPLIATDGTLWVERSVKAGESSRWDVIDGSGRLVTSYRLPAARRLVALGRTALYVAAVDDDGVERLERYAR
jgi:hypothetical protein